MKLCFIGDSHLGHVKPAWDQIAYQYPDISVDFKIERTYGDKPLQLVGGAAGGERIEFDDIKVTYGEVVDCSVADAFVVFGMHYSMNTLARTYAKYRSDALNADGTGYLLSLQCYQESANDLLMSHKAGRVIRSLRTLTEKPIIYVQQPNPLEWICDRADLDFGFYRSIVDANDASEFARVYSTSLHYLEEFGVQVSRQDPDTVSGDIFTKSEFGLADRTDSSADSLFARGDYYHMNSRYGLVALSQLLKRDMTEILLGRTS